MNEYLGVSISMQVHAQRGLAFEVLLVVHSRFLDAIHPQSTRVRAMKLLLVFISSSSLLVLTSPLSEMLQLFDLCYTPPNWQFHYKQKVFYADQGVITSKIREEES